MFTKADVIEFCQRDNKKFFAGTPIADAQYNKALYGGGCSFHDDDDRETPTCVGGYVIKGLAPATFSEMDETSLVRNSAVLEAFDGEAIGFLHNMQVWADHAAPWHVAFMLATRDIRP